MFDLNEKSYSHSSSIIHYSSKCMSRSKPQKEWHMFKKMTWNASEWASIKVKGSSYQTIRVLMPSHSTIKKVLSYNITNYSAMQKMVKVETVYQPFLWHLAVDFCDKDCLLTWLITPSKLAVYSRNYGF